jgi:predicted CopG family antitoxin
MATKTISLDLEAYEALRRHRRRGQSFSDVVKEHFGSASSGATLLRTVRDMAESDALPSDGALDEVERVVSERGASPARAVDFGSR